jgi:predicted NUDIX family NTP pyrophosphohydrolase
MPKLSAGLLLYRVRDGAALSRRSNTFELEWPRGSGQIRAFPEVDRVDWFPVAQARTKLLKGQRPFLDQLMAHPSLAGLTERY